MANKKARRGGGRGGRRRVPNAQNPLIGISMDVPVGSTHDAQVTLHEQAIGRPVDLIHVYHLWDTAFPTTDEAARTTAGQSVLYCWQTKRFGLDTPTWAQIASGTEDAVIDANAARIKVMNPAAPVYINFQNEPESSIGTPGSGLLGTAAEYVSAWRRIVDRFRAAGVTNVRWVWNVMGVMTTNQQNNALALYPGNSYVDWISYDPYNWAGARGSAWLSFAQIVQPWYDWAVANISAAKPYMLAEYGSVEDSTLPSLQDTFSGDLSRWPASVATTVVGGRARITCNTASNSLKSGPGYTFTRATAHIYPPAAGGAATSVTVGMRIESGTAGTFLSMEADRVTGLLSLTSKTGFADANPVTLTYSSTTHAWFQLRIAAGVVYWETSPDGTTWTNRRTTSSAAPGWVTNTTQFLNFPVSRDSGTTDYAEIDDVTTAATVPTPDANRKAAWFAGAQQAMVASTFPLLQALVYFDHIGSGGSVVTPDGWLLSSSAPVMPAYKTMALAATGSPSGVLDIRDYAAYGGTPGGFSGSGDDTANIRLAIASLTAGKTLQIPFGVVARHNQIITWNKSGTRFTGPGELMATAENTSAFWIGTSTVGATDVVIDGNLKFSCPVTTIRNGTNNQIKIRLFKLSTGAVLRNVEIKSSGASGMLIDSSDFLLEDVEIHNTRADGLHMTNGAHHGTLIRPYVHDVGDDMIVCMCYISNSDPVHHITCDDAIVDTNTVGRGMAVVGGQDIIYRNSTINNSYAGGIYVACEDGRPAQPAWVDWSPTRVQILGATVNNANTSTSVQTGAVHVSHVKTDGYVADVLLQDITINPPGNNVACVTLTGSGYAADIRMDRFTVTTNGSGLYHPSATGYMPERTNWTVNGVAQANIPEAYPPAVTNAYQLGYVGDSLTFQGGPGTNPGPDGAGGNVENALVADSGWVATNVRVSGVTGRWVSTEGPVTPTSQTTIGTWRAAGFDPQNWVIALGTNGATGGVQATQETYINELLDYIAAGAAPYYRVWWVNITYAVDTGNYLLNRTGFNPALTKIASERHDNKINLIPIDFHSLFHNGRNETGMWQADNIHMNTSGWVVRNQIIDSIVKP